MCIVEASVLTGCGILSLGNWFLTVQDDGLNVMTFQDDIVVLLLGTSCQLMCCHILEEL